MKVRTLSAFSALGMTLTAVIVYSVTPRFASATPAPSSTPEEATAPPVSSAVAISEGAHFKSGSTLTLEGTAGNASLVKGTKGDTYLLFEVHAAQAKASVRAPVNLALVVDRSGSMRGQRLSNAIGAARAAVDRLRDGDVVSVIAFDTSAKLALPPTTIDPSSRSSISVAIGSITLGGDTCISCGIEDAMVELEKTTGKVSRMVVLSDGDATAGVRDVPGFRSIAQRAQQRGINITTIGVNVDYNERILGAIAEEANGQHYFVQNESALARAFEEEAEQLGATVASNVEVAIDLPPGVQLDRVYDRSFKKLDSRVIVPLGAISRDETRTVLLKVAVTPEAERTPIARATLSYRDLTSNDDAHAEGDLSVKGVATPAEVAPIDPVVAGRVQRSETSAALDEASRLVKEHKVEEAQRRLQQQAQRVRAVASGPIAPGARKTEAERDLHAQSDALDRASKRFQPDIAQNPFEQGTATKESAKDSFDMRK